MASLDIGLGPNPAVTLTPSSLAILLGFHYSDHLHESTLRLSDKRIPVILTPQGEDKVRALQHFEHINLIPDMAPDISTWQSLKHSDGLPRWLAPIRMPGRHELNYLIALIWTRTSLDGREEHQAIYQSPHGLRLDQKPLQAFLKASPLPQPLALFHGLKESRAMGMTYGADGGLPLWRVLDEPKQWDRVTLFAFGVCWRGHADVVDLRYTSCYRVGVGKGESEGEG
ncbi:hypothetical protein LTR86_007888 [Recurvomyces mirabilis]|nr:hypothetical protein LTR86_007888 [Recurvomyces mirabilis]